MKIELPFSDYGQPFEKEYTIHDATFTIRVLRVGNDGLGPTWLFQLLVKGHQLEGGPYHPKFERELTDENVANQLASFWGYSQMVQEAQKLQGTLDWELNQIVEKCADFMFGYFIRDEGEHTDYDIISKFISEEEWTVVLRPNYMPNRLMEFYKKADREHIQIHSYIEDRELFQNPW